MQMAGQAGDPGSLWGRHSVYAVARRALVYNSVEDKAQYPGLSFALHVHTATCT